VPVGNGLTGISLMKNSTKKQQKNTPTSDSNSTSGTGSKSGDNSSVQSGIASGSGSKPGTKYGSKQGRPKSSDKKKKRPSPQRKRVQLAYLLLAVITASLLILLMMIPRVKEAEDQYPQRAQGESESEQQISELPGEGGHQPEEHPEEELEGQPEDTQEIIPPASDSTVEPGEEKYKDLGEDDIEALHPLGDIKSPPPGKGKLYLVIDDVGYNLEQLDTYLHLPISMTFALLPGLEYSQAAQDKIARSGEEMILHQPIEPIGDQNPGPGALYVGMDPEEMRAVVNENLNQFSEVIGVNNHMGSRGTSDPELMEALFSVLKGRHLFFLDSRTTARTVAARVAEEVGLPFSERNVFLDNIEDQIEIEKALSTALAISRSQGFAVMIGHVWSEELASTLALWYGDIEKHGYEFARLSSFFTEEHVHAGDGN